MIDRIVVESLLQACDQGADIKVPADPMLAELCRSYLAVLDAPVVCFYLDEREDQFLVNSPEEAAAIMAGQRVRLVRDGGE